MSMSTSVSDDPVCAVDKPTTQPMPCCRGLCVGIDLGSSYTRVSLLDLTKPMPTVLCNTHHSERTPTCVYFPPHGARSYGDAANMDAHRSSRFRDTFIHLPEQLYHTRTESSHTVHTVCESVGNHNNDNGGVDRDASTSSSSAVHPIPRMGYFLRALLSDITLPTTRHSLLEVIQSESLPVCLTVPPHTPTNGLNALRGACHIAGLDSAALHMVTSPTAAALYLHHTHEPATHSAHHQQLLQQQKPHHHDDKDDSTKHEQAPPYPPGDDEDATTQTHVLPDHVIVVNVGECNAYAAALCVSSAGVHAIGRVSSVPIGAGVIDAALCDEVVLTALSASVRERVRHDRRVRAKIDRACRIAKERLSTTAVSWVELEGLGEDGADARVCVTARELNACAAPFFAAMRAMLHPLRLQLDAWRRAGEEQTNEKGEVCCHATDVSRAGEGDTCNDSVCAEPSPVCATCHAVRVAQPDWHVEVIGGGWRLPGMKSLIAQALGVSQVSQCMDADRAEVEGAALMAGQWWLQAHGGGERVPRSAFRIDLFSSDCMKRVNKEEEEDEGTAIGDLHACMPALADTGKNDSHVCTQGVALPLRICPQTDTKMEEEHHTAGDIRSLGYRACVIKGAEEAGDEEALHSRHGCARRGAHTHGVCDAAVCAADWHWADEEGGDGGAGVCDSGGCRGVDAPHPPLCDRTAMHSTTTAANTCTDYVCSSSSSLAVHVRHRLTLYTSPEPHVCGLTRPSLRAMPSSLGSAHDKKHEHDEEKGRLEEEGGGATEPTSRRRWCEWARVESVRAGQDAEADVRRMRLNVLDELIGQTLQAVAAQTALPSSAATDSDKYHTLTEYLHRMRQDYVESNGREDTVGQMEEKMRELWIRVKTNYPELNMWAVLPPRETPMTVRGSCSSPCEGGRGGDGEKGGHAAGKEDYHVYATTYFYKSSDDHRAESRRATPADAPSGGSSVSSPSPALSEARRRLDQGRRLIAEEWWEHAETRFVQALEACSRVTEGTEQAAKEQMTVTCHLYLAMCAERRHMWKCAIEQSSRVLQIRQSNGLAYYYRGVGYMGLADYERAVRDLTKAQRYYRHDKVERALKTAKSLLSESQPSRVETFINNLFSFNR